MNITELPKQQEVDPKTKQLKDHTFQLVQELGELHRWLTQSDGEPEAFPERGSVPAPDGIVRLLALAFNRHLQDLQKWSQEVVQREAELQEENRKLREQVEGLRTQRD